MEACSKRQEGLAGAGPADQGDEIDLRVEQQLQGHPLLLGTSPEFPGALEGGVEMGDAVAAEGSGKPGVLGVFLVS